MIKKAKRIPEEVEYFVWEGDRDMLPDWEGLWYSDKTEQVHCDGRFGFPSIGDVIIKDSEGYVLFYSPAKFSALFVPLPEDG